MKNISIVTSSLLLSSLIIVNPAFSTDTKSEVTEQIGIKTGQVREKPINPTTSTSSYSTKNTQGEVTEQIGIKTGQVREKSIMTATTQSRLGNNMLLVDHIIGTEVQNQNGEKIGVIEKVVIDVPDARVGYVLLSGVGAERYIVPFNALQVSRSPSGQMEDTFTLQQTKDQLMKAPEGDIETVLNRDEGRQIHQYYGISPYWEERSYEGLKVTPEQERGGSQMEMR